MKRDLDTESETYFRRLVFLQESWFKRLLRRVDPYGYHLRRVCYGQVLEVGCGIGRVLSFMPNRSVGIDHNEYSVEHCRKRNLKAFTTAEFEKIDWFCDSFDTLLFSHVLEHMERAEAKALVARYLPFLKDGGRVILITPQEKGYSSDASHVNFVTDQELKKIENELGLMSIKQYSFPFVRQLGRFYIYNEFVSISRYV